MPTTTDAPSDPTFTERFIAGLKTASIVATRQRDEQRASLTLSNGKTQTYVLACACADIVVKYAAGFGYSLCQTHGFQRLGCLQFPRPRRQRVHLEEWERNEAKRKSGVSTFNWHEARGS